MKICGFIMGSLLACACVVGLAERGMAAETDVTQTSAVGTNADTAWKALQKALRPPMPPSEWSTNRPSTEEIEKFQTQQGVRAGKAAESARDFYTRFPEDKRAAEARKSELRMLQVASQLGNTNVEKSLARLEEARLNESGLSEDERYELKTSAAQRAVRAKSEAGEEAELAELEKQGRALIKAFPKKEAGYEMLFSYAQGLGEEAKTSAIFKELAASDAPEQIVQMAKAQLARAEAVGKPLDIKFTALDGRQVDVSTMKDKVTLIDFWATWCGPCVGELPHVKQAYADLHGKGFEIVGISLDSDKSALEKFVRKEEMPWPQYFDGKGWQNKISTKFGINSIPAMWLVDKKGNLRDTNARADLEGKVKKLLAE